jgi:hypothetical protein
MMTRAILVVAAIAATTLALSKGGAHADSLNIHQATLAEANQKTPEVSTEQLRRILADGSASFSIPARAPNSTPGTFPVRATWMRRPTRR